MYVHVFADVLVCEMHGVYNSLGTRQECLVPRLLYRSSVSTVGIEGLSVQWSGDQTVWSSGSSVDMHGLGHKDGGNDTMKEDGVMIR